MKISARPFRCRSAVLLLALCVAGGLAAKAQAINYLVTNDDTSPNGVTFYSIGAGGVLTLQGQISTPGVGIQGGYFGLNRLAVLDNGNSQCVFASEAATGDIAELLVGSGTVVGTATGSPSDTGVSNGIGLAVNAQYLYASFTDSSTIGTFQVQP